MNIRAKIYFIAAALVMGFASCAIDAPVQKPQEGDALVSATDAVPGQLLVRFDAAVADVLEQAGLTKSGPAMPMTKSGVLSVDQILDLVDGYRIERVFPVDPRSEQKARQEGLHLWYVVNFSEDYPVEKVAADLAKLGEVSRVEFNRTLKRASEKKAMPLTMEKVRQLTKSAATPSFNDPLLSYQWHLVNNGDLGATKFIKGADVQVEKAWSELGCTGDPSIIVAVLDEGVCVTHPDLKASMWVNEGEIYGLLGPNGAGKTTTLRMLATLIKPDSGDALVDGYSIVNEPAAVRSRIGFLTSELKLEEFFTPNYLFDFFSRICSRIVFCFCISISLKAITEGETLFHFRFIRG
mgnify:CR=1 FL=1